jgi:LysM repeat protein
VTPATTYTVARGDSLWSIAKRNHLSKADLAAANNLKLDASVLHVGQKLIIPSKPASPGGGRPGAPRAAPRSRPPAEKPSGRRSGTPSGRARPWARSPASTA